MAEHNKIGGLSSVVLTGLLVALNVVALNIILRHVDLRWDLTEDKRYEIGSATERVVSRLRDTVNIKCYVSSTLPKKFSHCHRTLLEKLEEYERIARELQQGNVVFSFVDPETDSEAKQECDDMGIQAAQVTDFEDSTTATPKICWFALVFRYGDRKLIYNLLGDMPQATLEDERKFGADLEFVLTRSIRNVATARKTIGLLAETQMVPINQRDPRSEKRPAQGIDNLTATLERTHDVAKLDIAAINRGEPLPGGLDVVVVFRPKQVSDIGRYILDQYLMAGGKMLFLVDNGEVAFSPTPKPGQVGGVRLQDYDMPTYAATIVDHGLADLFQHWGVNPAPSFVQDFAAYETIYYPSKEIVRGLGGYGVKLNDDYAVYPPWPVIPERDADGRVIEKRQRGDGAAILSPNDDLILTWCSPVEVDDEALKRHEAVAEVLLRSGRRSWVDPIKDAAFPVAPEMQRGAEGQSLSSRALAVLARGRFVSVFKDKEIPEVTGTAGSAIPTREDLSKGRRDAAAERGAVLVVGDADFCADGMIGGIAQIEQGRAMRRQEVGMLNRERIVARLRPALFFVSNCVDLLAFGDEAADLFELQAKTFRSRAIKNLRGDSTTKTGIQVVNLALVPVGVLTAMLAALAIRWFCTSSRAARD